MSGVLWITGVPASGKTTLARNLLAVLAERGVATLWLDSDDLRPILAPLAGYDDAGRAAFYAAIGHLAVLGERGGVVVVISATASRAAFRADARRSAERFVEIMLTCDRDTLRSSRDIKGLYRRADAGEIPTLPGVGVEFEVSGDAELTLETSALPPEAVAEQALAWLDEHAPALTGLAPR